MLTRISPARIFFLLLIMSSAAQAQLNETTFQEQINLSGSEIRMDSLLRIFARQTGVGFSFNSNKISPARKVPIPRRIQTLGQWLTNLNQSLGIQHKIVGNHIILIDNDKTVSGKTNTPIPSATKTTRDRNNPALTATKNDTRQDPNKQELDRDSIQYQTEVGKMNGDRSPVEGKEVNSNVPTITRSSSAEQPKKQTVPISPNVNDVNLADKTGPKMRSLQILGGYCKHGSGDMKGIVFGGEYTQYFRRKLSLSYNLRATINSSKDEILVTNGGTTKDASVRFTTAGVQIGVNCGWSFVNTPIHELRFSLGPFVRYQSASNGDDPYYLYYPITTGVPTVLVGYDNHTPQEIITFGGVGLLQYNFTFRSNLFLGAQTGLQTDANGDTVLYVGALMVGKRL